MKVLIIFIKSNKILKLDFFKIAGLNLYYIEPLDKTHRHTHWRGDNERNIGFLRRLYSADFLKKWNAVDANRSWNKHSHHFSTNESKIILDKLISAGGLE